MIPKQIQLQRIIPRCEEKYTKMWKHIFLGLQMITPSQDAFVVFNLVSEWDEK
jgi:hypothetical protein